MKGISEKLFWEFLKKCIVPFIMLLVFGSGYFAYTVKLKLFLNEQTVGYIDTAVKILVILFFAFFLQRMAGAFFSWYANKIAAKTHSQLDEEFMPLFRKTSNVIIWIVALIIILSFLGVNVNALIAALGVSSLAIALAAQDTIANVISGFLILVDRPFNIGDIIKLPSGEKAKVLDIGIRRSKFLSEDNAIVFVPNLDLSKSKIINYTYGEKFST